MNYKDDILLSIKPEYGNLILDGKKKFEYRKTMIPSTTKRVVMYASSPTQKVIGEFTCKDIIKMQAIMALELDNNNTNISLFKLKKYFFGTIIDDQEQYKKQCWVIFIDNVIRYEKPLKLADFGIRTPPRSWCYLNDDRFYLNTTLTGLNNP